MKVADTAWCWHWPSLDVSLIVSSDTARVLESYRQRWWQHERGGQLFVAVGEETGLLLAQATVPHADDRAGRTWLELCSERCRQEIVEANARGQRLVGYWHTHPEGIPHLSAQDVRSFQAFAEKNSTILPYPLAIIVGNSDKSDAIRAWSIRPEGSIQAQRI